MNIDNPINDALRILIIDDQESISRSISETVDSLECVSLSINDSRCAVQAAERFNPDVIFLDLCMPNIDGIQVMHNLSDKGCTAGIILMTGLNERILRSAIDIARALKISISGTLNKPFKREEIQAILQPVIEHHQSVNEVIGEVSSDDARILPGPVLQYEPIVTLSSEETVNCNQYRIHFCWRRDDGQYIPFLSLLDSTARTDMIEGITNLLMSKLREDIRRYQLSKEDEVRFYLPLLPTTLMQPERVVQLNKIYSDNLLTADMFTLEVEEKHILANPEAAQENLTSLSLRGCRIALGCTSESDDVIAKLKRLPVNEVVVDMSANKLLSGTGHSSEAEFWLGSLVSFTNREGLITNARHVTNRKQLSLASSCGVAKASGSELGVPQPAAQIRHRKKIAETAVASA